VSGRGRTTRGHREFTCFTHADPATVWSALTDPQDTSRYLYGLTAQSSWEPDSAIQFGCTREGAPGPHVVQGQVVHSDPPRRLTCCLSAGPGDPPTYLTWQIRPCSGGSTIRLHIDEPDPAVADTDEEAEETWLPVLAGLQLLLATRNPGGSVSAGDAQV
jgi:uncharacterized protein YndB with AHSA1/START domain